MFIFAEQPSLLPLWLIPLRMLIRHNEVDEEVVMNQNLLFPILLPLLVFKCGFFFFFFAGVNFLLTFLMKR